jgi:hypothetical protein
VNIGKAKQHEISNFATDEVADWSARRPRLHERDSAKKPLVIMSVERHERPLLAWRLVGKRDDARSSHDLISYEISDLF